MSDERPPLHDARRLAHEARSALNAIIGGAEMLREGRDGPADDRQRELVERILRGGRRLVGLIDQLADAAAGEALRSGADRTARVTRFAAQGPRLLAATRDAVLTGNLPDAAANAWALELPVGYLAAPAADDAVRRLATFAGAGDHDGAREALGDLEREIAEALVSPGR